MIAFSCPGCGKTFQVGDEFADRRTTCPRCRAALRVPGLAPLPRADDPAPPTAPRSELPIVVSSYIRQNLMPGETLVAITRIHPMVLVAPGVMAALGLLLSLVGIIAGGTGVVLAVFGVPMAFIAGVVVLSLLIRRVGTEYSCTDRRILIKAGLVRTQLRDMPLAKVEALVMTQGLFGKIFGYGTLIFKGSGGTRRACDHIEDPFTFYKRVQERVAAAQQHK